MLHLGHFSFDELDYRQNNRHGYFTCIVDASDEEEAVKRFKTHLVEMKQKNMAFSTIVKVYLEDIVQIETVPEKPLITGLQSSRGMFPKSISYSLPSAETDGVEVFGLKPDVQKQDNTENGDYLEAEPFLTF
jgi:hypothetical protein